MTQEMRDMLYPLNVLTFACGSTYTNPGRAEYRDTDLLVYACGIGDLVGVHDVVRHLENTFGGKVGGNLHSSYDSAFFVNVKVGDKMDFIITSDYAFYEKFVLASETARAVGLENKEQRIKLFKAILYGVFKP